MQRILLCLFALLTVAFTAEARERRAFVVGVEAYSELPALDTTVNDARALESVLRHDLRFHHVTYNSGSSLLEFKLAFGEFIDSIEPGDDVVFYFSGHGWSDGFENYLAFGDARKNVAQSALKLTTLNLTKDALDLISERQPGALILIIDACRNNPFSGATKSIPKGLVRVPDREGTLIAFAAGMGQEALARLPGEEGERLSLFSRELLPRLKDGQKPLARIFEDTRNEVQRIATTVDHVQRPAVYSELPLDFCFERNCLSVFDEEDAFWLQISAARDTALACLGYRRYLDRFPQGKYAGRATLESQQPACSERPLSVIAAEETSAACQPQEATVYFEHDRTNLNLSSVELLTSLFGDPGDCVISAVTVSGHETLRTESEEDGPVSEAYLVAVSERRASAVRDFAISQGVRNDLIYTEAFGSSKPAIPSTGREPLNRRVEITIFRNARDQ